MPSSAADPAPEPGRGAVEPGVGAAEPGRGAVEPVPAAVEPILGAAEPCRGVVAGAGPIRLQRDALTFAGYGVLCTWAWFLYGFGAVLPLLRTEEHTGRTVLGLHSLALASGSLISGVTTLPLGRRLRRRGAIRAGLGLVLIGTIAFCTLRRPLLTVPAALITGLGGSTMLNTSNPALSDHHGEARAAALSEGNALAAGVGLVAPLAVGAGVWLGIGWRPATLLVLALGAGLFLLVRRVPAGTALDAVPPPRRAGGLTGLPGITGVLIGLVMVAVGIEFCSTAWSADLLRQSVGLSAGAASAGLTGLVAGMAAGRVLIGRLALRLPAQRLLVAALTVTAAGWGLTWTSRAPVPALTGLVLTGFGIAGQYPLGIALAMASAPGRSDRVSSVIAIGLGLSAGFGPFGVGALADATSTHTAFLVVPALVLLGLTLLLITRAASSRALPDDPTPLPT